MIKINGDRVKRDKAEEKIIEIFKKYEKARIDYYVKDRIKFRRERTSFYTEPGEPKSAYEIFDEVFDNVIDINIYIDDSDYEECEITLQYELAVDEEFFDCKYEFRLFIKK